MIPILIVKTYFHMLKDKKDFSLVDKNGKEVKAEKIGLLLYEGGTVCDDYFNDNAANAICREMGFSSSTSWKSGSELSYGASQESLDITLDDITCTDNDWKTCSYSASHNCGHSEDVFLSCQSGKDAPCSHNLPPVVLSS